MKKTKNETENLKAAPAYQNQVTLIGHLGDAPEQRDGYAVFSLATKTSWKPKDATDWKERTEWHRIVAWGKLAEALKPLTKGDHVQVEGQLRSHEYNREFQVADGGVAVVAVRAWEIRASAVRKLAFTKKVLPAKAAA